MWEVRTGLAGRRKGEKLRGCVFVHFGEQQQDFSRAVVHMPRATERAGLALKGRNKAVGTETHLSIAVC